MNLYASLASFKAFINNLDNVEESTLLGVLESASRQIDAVADRTFYTYEDTRIYDGVSDRELLIHDLLAASLVEVDSGTGFVAWSLSDVSFQPTNSLPFTRVTVARDSGKAFPNCRESIRITGSWGAGDLRTSSPWARVVGAATVDAISNVVVVTDMAGVSAGQTLRVDAEQMYVQSVGESDINVLRGVNGTAAVAHGDAAVFTAIYPAEVVQSCLWLAGVLWRELNQAGLSTERIGEYSYKALSSEETAKTLSRLLGRVKRWG